MAPDIQRSVEAAILRRTWGRVRRLAVEADDGIVRVSAVVPSYYLKQLITEAAVGSVGPRDVRLQIDVEVRPSEHSTDPWADGADD
jgi:hypothetical protein